MFKWASVWACSLIESSPVVHSSMMQTYSKFPDTTQQVIRAQTKLEMRNRQFAYTYRN